MKLTGTTLWNNNFQNLFNIGVISLTNGQIMQRDSLEEQIHYKDLENHPDNSKLTKRTNNLFLIEGKAKFYWKWQDSENITNNDIEFRTGTNQPFKTLEGIVKGHDQSLKDHEKRFKRDFAEIKKNKEMLQKNGDRLSKLEQLEQEVAERLSKLEEEVADQTKAIGQIVVLIKQLSGSE